MYKKIRVRVFTPILPLTLKLNEISTMLGTHGRQKERSVKPAYLSRTTGFRPEVSVLVEGTWTNTLFLTLRQPGVLYITGETKFVSIAQVKF